jgi:hypothetical protein
MQTDELSFARQRLLILSGGARNVFDSVYLIDGGRVG